LVEVVYPRSSIRSADQRHQARRFVEAPGAERLQVDGDELESGRLERQHRRCPDPGQLVELRLRHLDARDLAVVANAELAQPQGAQRRLAARELRQAL